jgi:hypothetical protein
VVSCVDDSNEGPFVGCVEDTLDEDSWVVGCETGGVSVVDGSPMVGTEDDEVTAAEGTSLVDVLGEAGG